MLRHILTSQANPQVCKHFYALARDGFLWRNLYRMQFGRRVPQVRVHNVTRHDTTRRNKTLTPTLKHRVVLIVYVHVQAQLASSDIDWKLKYYFDHVLVHDDNDRNALHTTQTCGAVPPP